MCGLAYLAALIPGTTPDRKTFRRGDDAVEGIQFRPIDDRRLVAQKHLLAVLEAVDHDGAGVAQPNLEDGVFVFAPPFLRERQEVSRTAVASGKSLVRLSKEGNLLRRL